MCVLRFPPGLPESYMDIGVGHPPCLFYKSEFILSPFFRICLFSHFTEVSSDHWHSFVAAGFEGTVVITEEVVTGVVQVAMTTSLEVC